MLFMSLINSWKPFGMLVSLQDLGNTLIEGKKKRKKPPYFQHYWGIVMSGHFALFSAGCEVVNVETGVNEDACLCFALGMLQSTDQSPSILGSLSN